MVSGEVSMMMGNKMVHLSGSGLQSSGHDTALAHLPKAHETSPERPRNGWRGGVSIVSRCQVDGLMALQSLVSLDWAGGKRRSQVTSTEMNQDVTAEGYKR